MAPMFWGFFCLPEEPSSTTSTAIKWCTVGAAETEKCDTWSISSIENDVSTIECQSASSVEECIKKIMVCSKTIRS